MTTASPTGALIAVRRKKIEQAFRSAGAMSPGAAVSLDTIGVRMGPVFHRMVRSRVIEAAGPGLFYLDEVRCAQAARTRRWIVIGVVLIAVVGAILALTL